MLDGRALCAVLGLVAAEPAWAQQAPAANDGAQGAASGEIIVTARRQAENLERVPIAVAVVDRELIARRNLTSIRDVQYLTPSLTVTTNNTRNADNYTLRGQGTTFGTDPAVVAYFAEVPLPGGGGGPGNLFDLANIQVLNGPQGTLFGRNTTGGAVLFQPQRPTNDLGGSIQLGYGTHNNFQQQAIVNIPVVSDKLLIRAAISHRTRDGFTKDYVTGRDYDNINYTAARLSVLIKPADGIENYTVFNYTTRNEHGVGNKLALVNPLGPLAAFGAFAAATSAAQQAAGPRRTALMVPELDRQHVLMIVNQTKVSLGSDIDLRNIVSYSRYRQTALFDTDGSLLPVIEYYPTGEPGGLQSQQTPAFNQFTEELQLSGKALADKFQWQIGGYFQRNTPARNLTEQQTFGVVTVDSILGDRLTSKAAYAQATLDFGAFTPALDGLKFTGGYRYTHDRRRDFVDSYNQVGNDPRAGATCANGLAASFPNCRYVFDPRSFKAGTYTLGLSYQVDRSTMLYATARSGFKSGGFNLSAPVGTPFSSFAPEKVKDIEIGAKSQFDLGGVAMRASVAAFRDRYRNIQRVFVQDFGNGVGAYVVNAASARIEGVEVQADAQLTRAFSLGARYSYLHSRYGSFVSPQGDFTHERLPYTPTHKLSVTGGYSHELAGGLGTLGLSATYAYQSGYRNLDALDPDIVVPGYGLLSLDATWRRIGGSNFDLAVYATNVTNKLYRIGGSSYYYSLGFTSYVYGEPRMVGANVTYHFGGR